MKGQHKMGKIIHKFYTSLVFVSFLVPYISYSRRLTIVILFQIFLFF